MTHSLYVRQHSMTDAALSVYCSCGEFYKRVDYAEIRPQTNDLSHVDCYGVPLSVLMDAAEEHQNEAEHS